MPAISKLTTAPRMQVLGVDLFEQPYVMRMPFRFGAVTITGGTQAQVRVRIRLADGREAEGYAAEAMAVKWFDKSPDLTDAQNIQQLRRALEITRDAYTRQGLSTAFGLHQVNASEVGEVAARERLPPLVISYGPALLDRAVLDALCRAEGCSFWSAMIGNLPGMRSDEFAPDLGSFDTNGFLASLKPLSTLAVRHTVGLLDPLTASDQSPETRVNDGLPETLEAVLAKYGNRHLKIKLSGDAAFDRERLRSIALLLERVRWRCAITLDGNERFESGAAFAAFWSQMQADVGLRSLLDAVLWVEQPVARQDAFRSDIVEIAERLPVMIDESDDKPDAFLRAKAAGYTGVSSKSCKGFYKSIFNLARCRQWTAEGGTWFVSAEDLTNQPGLALQHDLALASLLGISHVERNAHHFIDGFAGQPPADVLAFLRRHPDLYEPADHDNAYLRINDGRINVVSLDVPGFATDVTPTFTRSKPMPAALWPNVLGQT